MAPLFRNAANGSGIIAGIVIWLLPNIARAPYWRRMQLVIYVPTTLVFTKSQNSQKLAQLSAPSLMRPTLCLPI